MGDNVKVIYNYDRMNVGKGSVESLVTLARQNYQIKTTCELARKNIK